LHEVYRREAKLRAIHNKWRVPVCAENPVRIDLMSESLNVNDDGRAAIVGSLISIEKSRLVKKLEL
jgi:hypothetical protein